jgi:hypothetical protein
LSVTWSSRCWIILGWILTWAAVESTCSSACSTPPHSPEPVGDRTRPVTHRPSHRRSGQGHPATAAAQGPAGTGSHAGRPGPEQGGHSGRGRRGEFGDGQTSGQEPAGLAGCPDREDRYAGANTRARGVHDRKRNRARRSVHQRRLVRGGCR